METISRTPRRVMVVSADMGGGHEATADAIEAAAAQLWDVETCRVDTLDAMGPGVGRLFRRIYVGNVERTPWFYEFFDASLWRHRWFAAASKRFTGSWSGRRLRRAIDRFDPDLLLSTYRSGARGWPGFVGTGGCRCPPRPTSPTRAPPLLGLRRHRHQRPGARGGAPAGPRLRASWSRE